MYATVLGLVINAMEIAIAPLITLRHLTARVTAVLNAPLILNAKQPMVTPSAPPTLVQALFVMEEHTWILLCLVVMEDIVMAWEVAAPKTCPCFFERSCFSSSPAQVFP